MQAPATIPLQIHIIWLGSLLPEMPETDPPRLYQTAVQNWKRHNPHYQVYLWTDPRTYPAAQQAQILKDMQLFAEKHGVLFRQIAHGDGYSDDFYEKEAGIQERQPGVGRDANWGAASDILRVNILLALGGIYVDTDILCQGPLSPLPAGRSLLCRIEPGMDFPSNNIIATTVNHPCMLHLQHVQRTGLTRIYNTQGILHAYMTDKGHLQSARAMLTMDNTGPMAFADALNQEPALQTALEVDKRVQAANATGAQGFAQAKKKSEYQTVLQTYEFPMHNILVNYHHSWL